MFSCRRLLILAGLLLAAAIAAPAVGIFSAAERNDVPAFLGFLRADPRLLHATDDAGQTCLHIAAANGATDIVTLLLAKGARLEAKGGFHQETPLLQAVNAGHTAVVRLLLAHGAQVNAVNDYGETPLRLALLTHRAPLVNLLRAKGGVPAVGHPIFAAADSGDPQAIARVLQQDPAALQAMDHAGSGWTALHVAASCGRVPAVDYLLARGRTPRARTCAG